MNLIYIVHKHNLFIKRTGVYPSKAGSVSYTESLRLVQLKVEQSETGLNQSTRQKIFLLLHITYKQDFSTVRALITLKRSTKVRTIFKLILDYQFRCVKITVTTTKGTACQCRTAWVCPLPLHSNAHASGKF